MIDKPTQSARELARRLLALEAASSSAGYPHAAVRVCEKLRVSLAKFAGPDGFLSLMRRALVLARAELPGLQGVNVNPDGSIEGLERVVADTPNGEDAGVAVITHLLGLLVNFVGKPIMLRLVRDAWPDTDLSE